MNPVAEVIGYVFTVILALWTIASLLTVIFPKRVWKITSGWKSTKEPNPSYFIMVRIIAVIFVLVGGGLLFFQRF